MISQNLKKLRAEKGLTQKQLAKVSKVSEVQISRYEKGIMKPNASVLKRLADSLKVTIQALEGEHSSTDSIFQEFTKDDLTKLFHSFISDSITEVDILTMKNTLEALSLQNRVRKLNAG